jgi:predicted transcriptional regulator of viral defense system
MKDSASEKQTRGLSARERAVLGKFMRKGRVTVDGQDVAKEFDLSRPLANKILLRLERKGWLQRGKRGVYIFVPLSSVSPETMPEDPWALAMELFSPCYISGFSAAQYWELTEQIFNAVVVYTSRPQRRTTQKLANITFRTHHIPESGLFGTKKVWRNNIPVLVADSHRTIVDVFDYPECGGGGRHTMDIAHAYWKSGKADLDALFQYALRLKRGVVFKRLGFSAELWGAVPQEWIERCMEHISSGISKLDPSGADKGRILTRWNLRINLPLEEYA